ncbi:hypothetical protein FACS1894216_10660 [Synergistales bacterium]|nr:hypothetical protein FACS1894216_10660 [Synergistales bacterium]
MNGSTARNDKFDKKIKRVERWLKRCAAACGCARWSSAMAEIESMEAEIRGLRASLWAAAEEDASVPAAARSGAALICARVVALAFVMLIFSAASVTMYETENTRIVSNVSRPSIIEPLSIAESDIINALRENLSSNNTVKAISITVAKGEKAIAVRPAEALPRDTGGSLANKDEETPDARTGDAVRNKEAAGTEEEVLSLIQVGQRALMTKEPIVRIIKE